MARAWRAVGQRFMGLLSDKKADQCNLFCSIKIAGRFEWMAVRKLNAFSPEEDRQKEICSKYLAI